jgi:cytochrome c oxidase subunit 2
MGIQMKNTKKTLSSVNIFAKRFVSSIIAISSFLFAFNAYANFGLNTSNGYNMPRGVTEMSHQIYDLHMIIFYVCVAIGIGVFGVMGYSMYKHRKSKGSKAANFHENIKVEIIWTIIPLIILIIIAIPATKVLIEREDVSKADINIKVTGSQWKWRYEYMDSDAKGISFFSNLDKRSREQLQTSIDTGVSPSYENYLVNVDNRLIVPTGVKIRFLITASDVIHSWWVPDFGVKQDAIPGFVNATWAIIPPGKEGVYRGECAELCGKDHAYMPVVVEAVSQEEFTRWVGEFHNAKKDAQKNANKEWTEKDLMTAGEQAYGSYCAACHQATGKGIEGIFPSVVDSAMVIGDKKELAMQILNGKGAMSAFRDQLDDAQIAAVMQFLRNGFNKVGDITQPSEVKAWR